MAATTSPIVPELPILRGRGEGEQRATFFELFFDLVYVFAVTQVSHHLVADTSWSGAAETALMLGLCNPVPFDRGAQTQRRSASRAEEQRAEPISDARVSSRRATGGEPGARIVYLGGSGDRCPVWDP